MYYMTESHDIDYEVNEIVGSWSATQFKLSVVDRKRHDNSPQTIRFRFLPPAVIVAYYNADGNENGRLQDCKWSGDREWWGELRNPKGIYHDPPIAKLSVDPKPGESITRVSRVLEVGNQVALKGEHPWSYRTIQHYPNWGPFSDCWRTGLEERTRGYNYLFSRNFGLASFWFIDFATMKGYEYFALDRNPSS